MKILNVEILSDTKYEEIKNELKDKLTALEEEAEQSDVEKNMLNTIQSSSMNNIEESIDYIKNNYSRLNEEKKKKVLHLVKEHVHQDLNRAENISELAKNHEQLTTLFNQTKHEIEKLFNITKYVLEETEQEYTEEYHHKKEEILDKIEWYEQVWKDYQITEEEKETKDDVEEQRQVLYDLKDDLERSLEEDPHNQDSLVHALTKMDEVTKKLDEDSERIHIKNVKETAHNFKEEISEIIAMAEELHKKD